MKLCKDCKWYVEPTKHGLCIQAIFNGCQSPRFVSVVTGEVDMDDCEKRRLSTDPWMCGLEARFFEQKEDK